MLRGKVQKATWILGRSTYPYIRRIAGAHGNFSVGDYEKWLKQADEEDLAQALGRIAQLNQSKTYLFWRRKSAE